MVKKEDYLGYEEDDKPKYEDLTKKKVSPFYKNSYADVFLFALSLAIKNNSPQMKLKGKVNRNIPVSALRERIWILNSIAIEQEKTHRALHDKEKVYQISEQYANAGIKELYAEIFEKPGDFYKKMEKLVK